MKQFKIALPGFTIKDAQPENLAVTSLYPNPKIYTKARPPHAGVIRLNWNSTGITVPTGTIKLLYSFPHNYNYVPSVIGVYSFDNGINRYRGTLGFQYGFIGFIILDADKTNINLKWLSFDGSTPVPQFLMQIRFYVFAERGYE